MLHSFSFNEKRIPFKDTHASDFILSRDFFNIDSIDFIKATPVNGLPPDKG